MRKSNYLVLGAAAVVAALLLVLWYHLGFNRIDSPLDLVLAIVWWVGIVAIAAILVRFEERRRRQIRTLYVSPKSLYSSELGMVGIGEAGAVGAMRGMLGQLKYGFDSKVCRTARSSTTASSCEPTSSRSTMGKAASPPMTRRQARRPSERTPRGRARSSRSTAKTGTAKLPSTASIS